MEAGIKEESLEHSIKTIEEIADILRKTGALNLAELPADKTVLVIVDMVNGFAREGVLKSPRVEMLIPVITGLQKACIGRGVPILAFADNHTEASPEFASYPKHCISGSSEGKIVDEIKENGGYLLIPKNSTNGFLEEEFGKWLGENMEIKNFIVTGDCTDICIQQFAITLKAWFNMLNEEARVIVPVNAVDTYDLGIHCSDLMNTMALYNMMINGVELVSGIN